MAAIIAPGLTLAFRDRKQLALDGKTVRNEHARRTIWVCGAGAFVAMKALAFRSRGENKDAYDFAYLVRNYGAGPADVAAQLAPSLKDAEAQEAVRILAEDFATVR